MREVKQQFKIKGACGCDLKIELPANSTREEMENAFAIVETLHCAAHQPRPLVQERTVLARTWKVKA